MFRFDRARRIRRFHSAGALIFASATALSFGDLAPGQTSGSWIAQADGSWSVAANWSPAVPGGGGVATFGAGAYVVDQDLPDVTLDAIVFGDDAQFWLIHRPSGNTTNTITLTDSATVHVAQANPSSYTVAAPGHTLDIPIGGAAGLRKTGGGLVTLFAANPYMGGTTISAGVLRPWLGDPGLGDPSGSVTLAGGTLRVGFEALDSTRAFHIAGVGTLDIRTFDAARLHGAIAGTGTFHKAGGGSLTVTAPASFGGAVVVHGGSVVLSGSGALAGAQSVRAGGSILLDNSVTNVNNRLPDLATIAFTGTGLEIRGHAAAPTAEALGTAVFASGRTAITVAPDAAQPASLTAPAAERERGATAFLRGRNLGAAPGGGVANVHFNQAPALVGGGGAPGSTNVSIIPWAVGAADAAAAIDAPQNGLVTYGPTGVRPLNLTTEYSTSIAPGASANNVRLTSAQTVGAPSTVNALVLAPGGSVGGTSTLTVSSGALLNLSAGATIDVNLDFASAEGIIHCPGSLTINGAIGGGNGVTVSGFATLANANSTYTGPTTVGAGSLLFTASVPAAGPGPLGSDTSPVVLAPGGSNGAALIHTGVAPATFARDLHVRGSAAQGSLVTLARFGGSSLTMNGNVVLDAPLVIQSGLGSVILNGTISGPGFLSDLSLGSRVVLNGDNTYTGGTEINGGTWAIGSDTAFGTGPIRITGTFALGPTLLASGGPRVVANDVALVRDFSAQRFWTIAGASDLTFTGAIELGLTQDHQITSTGVTTYAGPLRGARAGFTKSGNGVLVLGGDNTYAGPTTITSGVLRVGHSNALGSPRAPTYLADAIGAPAVLELPGGALTAEPVVFEFGGGRILNSAGDNSLGDVTTTGLASITVAAGTLRVGNVEDFNLFSSVQKDGAGRLVTRRVRVGDLTIAAGTLAVAPGRTTEKTSHVDGRLQFAGGAAFDLGDNDLVINTYGTGFNQLATLRDQLLIARAGGGWTGSGVTSSLADASQFALGYASRPQLGFPATFSGIALVGKELLVRYTRYGDANLDGTVNLTDFNRLAANFGATERSWFDGDFDYNGGVNLADFNLLASNFGLGAAGAMVMPGDWSALAAAVPEPTVGTLVLGAAALMCRVRRRRVG